MTCFTTIESRLTHRYVDSAAHMDQWGPQVTVKVLGGRVLDTGNGYDVGPTTRFTVVAPKTADAAYVTKALRDTFSYQGCSHEYDCCGCGSSSAHIRKVKRGVFSVLLSTSRNY